MHSSGFFRTKPIARLIFKCKILGSHTISDQSLLLSTNVLNDMVELVQAVNSTPWYGINNAIVNCPMSLEH